MFWYIVDTGKFFIGKFCCNSSNVIAEQKTNSNNQTDIRICSHLAQRGLPVCSLSLWFNIKESYTMFLLGKFQSVICRVIE